MANYCTTLELMNFMGLVKEIPAFAEGSSSTAENVGTGDGSEDTFYLDHNNVIASSYTFKHHASDPDSGTALTETTHYTLDKDAGKLVLTTAGKTAVSTNKIYAWYKYSIVPDSVADDAVEEASRLIDNITNSSFESNTATDEYHDGKGDYETSYFTKNVPIISVTTLSTTQNNDETASASTTWDSLTEDDHFFVDLKTGRLAVQYSSYRPTKGKNRLKVTYTWGHSSVPVAIKHACIRLAAQHLMEGTVVGGVMNAKLDSDSTKYQFSMDDIRKNLRKYTYSSIEST